MDKSGLLRSIAESGYNVGFGAKKHFATYDIVEKGPGWISFLSMAVGIFALVFDELSAKVPSASLLVAGVIAFYITYYRSAEYEAAGKKMTTIYNELRDLYRSVDAGADLGQSSATLKRLESEFYDIAISKQILFSDWYAHLKFFGQHQSDWVVDELKLKFWSDKVPTTAKLALVAIAITALVLVLSWLDVAGLWTLMKCAS